MSHTTDKKYKVAVVGLYTLPNMGDRILCDCTEYLIKQFDPEIEIVQLDVNPRFEWMYEGFDHYKYRKSKELKKKLEKRYKYNDTGLKRYVQERFMWRLREYSKYKRTLAGVDAIVFCGGGFVKFRTQGLNYYVEMITEYANRKHIPVMFNAIGVEGYDDSDIRCAMLKKHLNMRCVKSITTRDDYNRLKQYIRRDDIDHAMVGDPALWSPECYGIERIDDPEKIGVNLIRAKIFGDYGNTRTPDEIHDFYVALITELRKRNLDIELFSNGMPGDQKMGKKLVEEMGLPESMLRDAPETGSELMQIVASYRAVFGARLHACITSFALGVPVTGMIWNEKARFFASVSGKEGLFFEEDELDPVNIADAIEKSAESHPTVDERDRLRELTKEKLNSFLNEYLIKGRY